MYIQKPPLGAQIDWANPLTNGLVACYMFNEGQGDKIQDLSGNGNTGTLSGFSFPATTASGWNPGKDGHALAFNATNSNYIECGNSPVLNLQHFTIEGLFFHKLTAATQYLFAKNNAAAADIEYATFIDGTTHALQVFLNGSSRLLASTVLADNTWYHFAVIYNKVGIFSYINGVNDGSAVYTANITSTAYTLNIGRRKTNNLHFSGHFSHFRIWNRAMKYFAAQSNNEILSLYTNPYGMFL